MSLTLSAIVLIFLFMPGYLLLVGYTHKVNLGHRVHNAVGTETTNPVDFTKFTSSLLWAVMFSGPLHLVWISITNFSTPYHVNINSAAYFLAGSYSNNNFFNTHIGSLTNYPLALIAYFLTLYIFSYFCGSAVKFLVIKFNLDSRISFFRFPDEWHYIFNGEDVDSVGIDKAVEFIIVSAAVTHNKNTYIYTGVLHRYHLDTNHKLQWIILSYARRYRFASGNAEGEIELAGELFMVDCATVKTLDIDYWFVAEEEDPDGTAPGIPVTR